MWKKICQTAVLGKRQPASFSHQLPRLRDPERDQRGDRHGSSTPHLLHLVPSLGENDRDGHQPGVKCSGNWNFNDFCTSTNPLQANKWNKSYTTFSTFAYRSRSNRRQLDTNRG